jgi:AcrR family transcriptional regulator
MDANEHEILLMNARPHDQAAHGPRDERGVLAARILAAARASFGENGWAGTTVRGVARDADVDPALVHHYFGSKAGLLDAATTAPPEWAAGVVTAWSRPDAELGESLVRNVLANWNNPEFRPIMLSVLLTAAHEPSTREKLARVIAGQLMGPGLDRLDSDDRELRAGLVATQLFGFMMMRYVWKIEPIVSLDYDQAVAALAPTIQRYLDGPIDQPA